MMTEIAWKLTEVFATSVVSSGVATVVLRYWLNFQFEKRLDIHRQQFRIDREELQRTHERELSRLRVEIEKLVSASVKLMEVEVAALLEAWNLLNEAYADTELSVSVRRSWEDLDRLNEVELREYLADKPFFNFQKDEVIKSSEKKEAFIRVANIYEELNANKGIANFAAHVASKSVLLSEELKVKFDEIAQALSKVMISRTIAREENNSKLTMEAQQDFYKNVKSLNDEIYSMIRSRLLSHTKFQRPEESVVTVKAESGK